MGPSKREKSAPPGARMNAVRSLLSPSSSASPPPQAEWSSPAFTRARARPSNLHSYVRASPSFPLSQHHQNQQHNQNRRSSSSGGRSNTSTSSGNALTQQSEWRSRRTQATQTPEKAQTRRATDRGEQLSNTGDRRSIQLGAYGLVSDMSIDTVDLLIRALEDRKQELLVPSAAASPVTLPPRTAKKKKKANEEQYTESSDESDATASPASPPSPAYPRAIVVRSRSYEALVQLEGILEARHQQLMRDGVLEPPAPPSSATSNATAAAWAMTEDEAADGSGLQPGVRVMTNIQEEIRKMHRSLRHERSAAGSSYAGR